jgi:hypothetical protein
MVFKLQEFSGFKWKILLKRCFEAYFHYQVVPCVKINNAKDFGLKNYPYKYIYTFIFASSHEIDEIALFITRWRRVPKLIMPKFSPPKVTIASIFVDHYIVPVLLKLHWTENCIQIMHFRYDEKFLELTKILEIKNKGNYRGSVPIFRQPKWHFFKIFLVSVFWNTLVQVGVNC